MKRNIILLLSLLLALSIFAQHSTKAQIVPIDSAVRKGVLSNGLTYYIRKATEQKGIAEFRLVQKTGSLVETDRQRGMAHFLEHMMFRGTKHFPGRSILDFLRQNGIPFGDDVNAMTYFNHVEYKLSEVPLTGEGRLDTCLLILRDWSADALINSSDLDAERNVVVEEWRLRSAGSSSLQSTKNILSGTRYVNRIPFEGMDIVKTCSAKQMRKFYHHWYQPQNQCVVVTGDIDCDEVEMKIKALFGDLKRGKIVIPEYDLPKDPDSTCVYIIPDKNVNQIIVSWHHFCNTPSPEEMKYVRGFFPFEINDDARSVINNRLRKLKSANAFTSNTLKANIVYPGLWEYCDYATFDPSNYKDGLCNVFKNLLQVKRYGFSNSDKEALSNILPEDSVVEDTSALSFTVEGKIINDSISASIEADKCVTNFITGYPLLLESVKDKMTDYLPRHIRWDEVTDAAVRLHDPHNAVINVVVPEYDGYTPPTEKDILDLLHEADTCEIELYKNDSIAKKEEKQLDLNTITIAAPGKVVRKQPVKGFDYTEYLLSNGVKVWVYNEVDTLGFDINLHVVLPGGISQLDSTEVKYKSFLRNRPISSDGRKFDAIESEEFNANEIYYELNAFGNDDSLIIDKVFRYLYYHLTCNEVDDDYFNKELKSAEKQSNLAVTDLMKSSRKLSTFVLAGGNHRTLYWTPELVKTLNKDELEKILARYHSNYRGMTLVVSSRFPLDSIIPYLEKYVASLPSLPKASSVVTYSGDHIKDYDDQFVAYIDLPQPYGEIHCILAQEKDFKFNPTSFAHVEALGVILNQLLTNNIRIKNSDTYSISTMGLASHFPYDIVSFPIICTCNPDRIEAIITDVHNLVQQIANGDLITQSLIDSYVNLKDKKVDKPSDKNSLDYVSKYLQGQGYYIDPKDTAPAHAVTVESLRKFAQSLLKNGHWYDFVIKTK